MSFTRIQFISLSVLLPLSLTRTMLHGGPVGIALCRQICFNTIGCESYTYLPDQLICLKGNSSNTITGKMVTRRLKKPRTNYQRNCQTGSKVFMARNNRQVCTEVKGISGDGSETTSVLPNDRRHVLRTKGYHEIEKRNATYMLKLYTDKRSWGDAMKQCKEDGGLLAQFNKAFKWELLPRDVHKAASMYTDNTWIGLSDQHKNDKYVWADGTEMMDKKKWFNNYFSSEPSHRMYGIEEDCATIYYMSSAKQYFVCDFPCSTHEQFLCEVEGHRDHNTIKPLNLNHKNEI